MQKQSLALFHLKREQACHGNKVKYFEIRISLFTPVLIRLGDFGDPPATNLSIVNKYPRCGLKPLNQYQEKAVREALVKPFTLVQGPPGK